MTDCSLPSTVIKIPHHWVQNKFQEGFCFPYTKQFILAQGKLPLWRKNEITIYTRSRCLGTAEITNILSFDIHA